MGNGVTKALFSVKKVFQRSFVLRRSSVRGWLERQKSNSKLSQQLCTFETQQYLAQARTRTQDIGFISDENDQTCKSSRKIDNLLWNSEVVDIMPRAFQLHYKTSSQRHRRTRTRRTEACDSSYLGHWSDSLVDGVLHLDPDDQQSLKRTRSRTFRKILLKSFGAKGNEDEPKVSSVVISPPLKPGLKDSTDF